MGIGNLDSIVQRLIENGMSEDTPAALVANATFPTQRLVKASLGTLKQQCERQNDTSALVESLGEGTIDWVTFASPSSVDGLLGQVPSGLINSSKAKVASIGPVTSGRLKELGVKVDVTAAAHTIDGLLDSIEQEESHNGFS